MQPPILRSCRWWRRRRARACTRPRSRPRRRPSRRRTPSCASSTTWVDRDKDKIIFIHTNLMMPYSYLFHKTIAFRKSRGSVNTRINLPTQLVRSLTRHRTAINRCPMQSRCYAKKKQRLATNKRISDCPKCAGNEIVVQQHCITFPWHCQSQIILLHLCNQPLCLSADNPGGHRAEAAEAAGGARAVPGVPEGGARADGAHPPECCLQVSYKIHLIMINP